MQLYTADTRASISATLAVHTLDGLFSSSPALSSGQNNFSFPVTQAGAATTQYDFTIVRDRKDTGAVNKLLSRLALRAAPAAAGMELPLLQRALPGVPDDDTEGFNSFVFNYSAAALPDTTAVNVTAIAHYDSSRTARLKPDLRISPVHAAILKGVIVSLPTPSFFTRRL